MGVNLSLSMVLAGMIAGINAQDNSQYADPHIGNVAPILKPNRPAAYLPNQLVRVFPNRKDHLDNQITDFPLTVYYTTTTENSPAFVFGIKPSIDAASGLSWSRRLGWDRTAEIAKPWYFSTFLTDDKILTEFAPGQMTGIYRFTFPVGTAKNILLSHPGTAYQFASANEVYGTQSVNDPGRQQAGSVYLYGVFPDSPAGNGVKPEGAWAAYSAAAPSTIEFRYALSLISRDQAKRNFLELNSTTFAGLQAKAKAVWDTVLGQITVEGGTEAQKRIFFSALYRTHYRMINISEGNQYYSGYDKAVHADSVPVYSYDYTWGTYPALHPLRALLDPDMEGDMLQSYVRFSRQSGGWMPETPELFGERANMFGFYSTVVFLDAYRKGIRNFDVGAALAAMVVNAETRTMLPVHRGPKGPEEDYYYKNGYYPVPSGSSARTGAVAVTLAGSYNGWAISQLAKDLGNNQIGDRLAPRALNYKTLWNAQSGFFLPKDDQGKWIQADPLYGGGGAGLQYWWEGSGWVYEWHVQHDIPGLIGLMGGADKFEAKLDQFFTDPPGWNASKYLQQFPDNSSLVGIFGIGNENTFFEPYLYNYTGSPWKTQNLTRLLLDKYFTDDIRGCPGDDDGGAMAAWVVFSAMGFYPVSPGIPMYAITSPLFNQVAIKLRNGKTFTVIAHNNSAVNKYIQSATLNGVPLASLWFSHQDILDGGTLTLEMGSTSPIATSSFIPPSTPPPTQAMPTSEVRVYSLQGRLLFKGKRAQANAFLSAHALARMVFLEEGDGKQGQLSKNVRLSGPEWR